MSSQSFANLANSEFNGNIVLNNGYIKYPDGSIQYNANGGSATGVFTDQGNTFENGFTQTFNGEVSFNNNVSFSSPVDITSYTDSNIIGQPILSSTPTIIDSVLLGNEIGNGIINIDGTIAIGYSSANQTTTNTNGISIGKESDLGVGATNNIAIGYGAMSNADNCIVIGANATSGNDNEILLGNSSNYVTIPNYLEFSDGTQQTTAFSYAGKSINSIGGASTTSWAFNTEGFSNFNILLATNITSLLPQVYTGSYSAIPQSYTFTISSAVLQNTSVNSIFTATNPNAQTQPINFTGLYANGINTIVNTVSTISSIEPTDFGTAFFNNVDTNTTATISPYFPAITGNCYLNITTAWDGTDYIVYTTYDFQEINMSSNTTFQTAFNTQDTTQQINVNYTGGNLSTPILLQLNVK
jgi:hypothetical protein